MSALSEALLSQSDKNYQSEPLDNRQQFQADVKTATKYVVTDAKRNKSNFFVGSFTVFLVVMFITLLQAAVARSPVVFLKLAQDQVGEYDVVFAPGQGPSLSSPPVSSGFLLNFTEIASRTQGVSLLGGTAPRWLGLSRVFANAKNSTAIVLVIDSAREKALGIGRRWPHPALGAGQAHLSEVVMRRLGIEPGAEIEMVVDLLGLAGQTAGFDADSAVGLLQSFAGQASGDQLAQLTNVSLASVVGQINTATGRMFSPEALARYLFTAFGQEVPKDLDYNASLLNLAFSAVREGLTLRQNLTIVDGIADAEGKFPKALGNVMVLEKDHVATIIASPLQRIADALRGLAASPLRFVAELALRVGDDDVQAVFDSIVDAVEAAEEFDIDQYAMTVVGTYTDRVRAYQGTSEEIDGDMITFTNAIVDQLGFGEPVTMSTPLAGAMRTLYFIRLFLDQIFNFASVVLIGLGSLLIYSLLLSNVEEKTFEYGMLRAQGMRQHVLIELLLIQSVAFSIPGIVLGILAAWAIYVPLGILVNVLVDVPLEWRMSGGSILTGIVIGVLMPLVANAGPISSALSSTLRDSIDKYHSAEDKVSVRIIAMAKVGLAPWQVALSVLMIVMGFVVYYLMPYSFIFNNIPLFLSLLTLILLGMLVGLSLVAQILQPMCERGISWLVMWGSERRRLRPLVLKALHAHGRRNRKTAIMFTTALAFIIFVGTSFELQAHSISDNIELGIGADVAVLALNKRFPIPYKEMGNYLDIEMQRRKDGETDAYVLGYTFETFPLDDYAFVRGTAISNLAGYPSLSCRVVGMQRAYVNETFTKFYRVTEAAASASENAGRTRTGAVDLIDALYSNAGNLKLSLEERDPDSTSQFPPPNVMSERVRLDSSNDEPFLGSPTAGYEINLPNDVAYSEYVDVSLSEALRLEGAIDVNTPLLINIQYQLTLTNASSAVWLAKAQGMIGKMSGDLSYSSYRQLARASKVAVSIPQYTALLRQIRNASAVAVPFGQPLPTGANAVDGRAGMGGDGEPPAMSRLYVRIDPASGLTGRESVINALRNYISDDITQVLDTAELVESTAVAISALQYFFIVVTVIAIILCFFVLWLSFTANIRENAWEFGVLRAVGLSAAQVMRIYVYEAFCLIAASLLLGTVIGVAQAMTLTLQFGLFTELPFTFDFPTTLFVIVIVMSFGVALLGSYVPARNISKKKIASVLKGL